MVKKFCNAGNCHELTDCRYCAKHRRAVTHANNHAPGRAEDRKFYKSKKWREIRAATLSAQPLCVECLKFEQTVIAEHVDHIQPRSQRPDLAFDPGNLQPLCIVCHGKKTAGEVWHGRGRR